MNAIKGTWKNGQVVLTEAASWPDGTQLMVEPVSQEQTLGSRDEDWPTTPEGIARHLALMDQIEPLEMPPEEEAQWHAARKAQKQRDLATWEDRSRIPLEVFDS